MKEMKTELRKQWKELDIGIKLMLPFVAIFTLAFIYAGIYMTYSFLRDVYIGAGLVGLLFWSCMIVLSILFMIGMAKIIYGALKNGY